MLGGKYWIVGKPAIAASLQISWEQESIPRDFYRTLFFCAISAEQVLTLWQTLRNLMFLFVSKPGCFSLPHSRLQLPENILRDGVDKFNSERWHLNQGIKTVKNCNSMNSIVNL